MLNLDLDGVFVDFHKRIKEITKDNPSMSNTQMWKRVEEIENFFLHLDPVQNAKEFFDEIISRSTADVRILTALPLLTNKLITAPHDKRVWVSKHLCPKIQVVCSSSGKEKRIFAQTGHVLLDDKGENIELWEEAGGIGVLHITNEHQASLNQLKEIGIIK